MCQYILVFQPSQGLQQLPIAHLYILVRNHGSLVRQPLRTGYHHTLEEGQFVRVQQSLRTGDPHILAMKKHVQALLSLPIERLYKMVSQQSLVLQTLLIQNLQFPVQAFQAQQLHQIELLYIRVRKHGSLVQRWHQLEFPDIQVAEKFSLLRLLLQIVCQYILVFQLSQGLQQLPIAHLYILVRKHGSQAHLFLQTGVFHSVQLPS